jgi:hypothetical protein
MAFSKIIDLISRKALGREEYTAASEAISAQALKHLASNEERALK